MLFVDSWEHKKCLNVRQKLGTLKFSNVFLRFPMFSNVFQCYLLSFSLSLTISLSHSLTLSHSHTLSISHWITLDMLNNFCFHLYAQNSLSHSLTLSQSLTLTLSHSHTLSISHSITLDMLNKFCFHLYAQKSLFIAENCNAFFSWEPALWTLKSQGRVMRRRRSKKNIAIFAYKQRLLSIEMKTKLVQHVESEWMRDWKSVRLREWLLNIDMKTKVVQHVESEWKSESVRVRHWDMRVWEWESERVRVWEWESDFWA